jgi:hypothetical protein
MMPGTQPAARRWAVLVSAADPGFGEGEDGQADEESTGSGQTAAVQDFRG